MITSFSYANVATLPSPNILELKSYESIVKENIEILQQLKEDAYLPLEDDTILTIVEAFAYRELHLRAIVNLKVKSMMSHYATGTDLDNFCWSFYGGITRLQGAYPYADFKFTNVGTKRVELADGTIVSTAGAVNSYYFHILNSDIRVDTAYCYSPTPGVVSIVVDNFEDKIDDEIIEQIVELFNNDEIRPLTDKVEVSKANQIRISLNVEIKLFDVMQQQEINTLIQENFKEPFKINENLTFSDLIQRLHVAGVYSARCLNIAEDIVTDHISRIIVEEVNCVFSSI